MGLGNWIIRGAPTSAVLSKGPHGFPLETSISLVRNPSGKIWPMLKVGAQCGTKEKESPLGSILVPKCQGRGDLGDKMLVSLEPCPLPPPEYVSQVPDLAVLSISLEKGRSDLLLRPQAWSPWPCLREGLCCEGCSLGLCSRQPIQPYSVTLQGWDLQHWAWYLAHRGCSKISNEWASLVVQWLRINMLVPRTQVQSLVWKDPTCHGST